MAERKRRDNGQGTISQRKSGLWAAAAMLPDGRRKWVYAKSEDVARKRLRDLLTAIARGQSTDQSRETVAAYLARWLADIASPRLAPTTQRRYAIDVARMRRYFGPLRLAALTPRHVQELLDTLAADGLAPRSIRHCRAVLRVALHDAETDSLISATTAGAATRARPPKLPDVSVEALPVKDARAILAALQGDPLEMLVTVALGTGLRQGELLGLRWQDVALETASLTVRNQLQRLNGAYVLRPPKTVESQARVPLAAFVVDALRSQRAIQNAQRLQSGAAWRENDLVFCTRVGTPLNGSAVTHTFQKRLAAAGLAEMRFHDLRHATASLLFASGASLKSVQTVLRHARIATTADIYTRAAPEMQHEAVSRLGASLRDELL